MRSGIFLRGKTLFNLKKKNEGTNKKKTVSQLFSQKNINRLYQGIVQTIHF